MSSPLFCSILFQTISLCEAGFPFPSSICCLAGRLCGGPTGGARALLRSEVRLEAFFHRRLVEGLVSGDRREGSLDEEAPAPKGCRFSQR